MAQSLPLSNIRNTALARSVAKLSEIDLNKALSLLKRLDPSTRFTAGQELIASWAERDPIAALNYAEASPDANVLLRTVEARWAKSDPSAALDWIRANPNHDSALGLAIVDASSSIDPQTTVEAMMKLSQSGAESTLLRFSAIRSWLLADPVGANKWLESQAPAALTQVILAASNLRGDPAAQLWLMAAERLPAGAERTNAVQNLMSQWSSVQPDAALEHLAALNDTALTTQVLPTAIKGIARTEPELAFKTALNLPDDGEAGWRRDTLGAVVASWVKKDPVGAAQSAVALQDDPAKLYIFAVTASSWGLTDPPAASAWAQQLSPGPARDAALSGESSALKATRPDLAIVNAQAITSPGLREVVIKNIK